MKISLNSKRAKEIRKRLSAENRKFQKLSKDKQRIAIAEDVIKQIKAKKFIANSVYFELNKEDGLEEELGLEKVAESDLDFGECIAQVGCQVCGIGSLFASAVMKHDKVKAKKFIEVPEEDWDAASTTVGRSDEVSYLKKWFSSEQLDMVESFFERHLRATQTVLGVSGCFYDSLPEHPILDEYDPNIRLIMIMENIISNGGKFDPLTGKHSGSQDEQK